MVKLYVDTVWTKIYGMDIDIIKKVKETLRFHPEGYFFSKKYQKVKVDGTRVWDGYINLCYDKGSMFLVYTGMVSATIQILKSENIQYEIIKQYDNSNIQIDDVPLNGITLRDYQLEAVNAIKKRKRGIIEAATGAGKTEICIKAVADIKLKSLIIVNRTTLFRQIINKLKDRLGLRDDEINFIGDIKQYNPNNRITVATFQSLFTKIKGKTKMGDKIKLDLKHSDALKSAQMVITDEVHHASMNCLGDLLKYCTNTKFRIGVSATPQREDGYDMMLEALFGQKIFTIGISELIQKGYLARPKIYMFKTPYFLDKNLSYRAGYGEFIKNENKNKLIAEIAYRFGKIGKSVLISFTRVEHLKLVKKELDKINELNLTIKSIVGDNTATQKIDAIQSLDTKEFNIVLSTLFGEGVDVPSLDVLINARNAKSAIDAKQQTGRVIRKYKIGEINGIEIFKEPIVIDFLDYNTFDGEVAPTLFDDEDDIITNDDFDMENVKIEVKDFFQKYARARLKIYQSEPEFKVVIINNINEIEEINRGGING